MKRIINEVRVINTACDTEFKVDYEVIDSKHYELITKAYDLSNVPDAVIKFIQNKKTVKVNSISSACTLYYKG